MSVSGPLVRTRGVSPAQAAAAKKAFDERAEAKRASFEQAAADRRAQSQQSLGNVQVQESSEDEFEVNTEVLNDLFKRYNIVAKKRGKFLYKNSALRAQLLEEYKSETGQTLDDDYMRMELKKREPTDVDLLKTLIKMYREKAEIQKCDIKLLIPQLKMEYNQHNKNKETLDDKFINKYVQKPQEDAPGPQGGAAPVARGDDGDDYGGIDPATPPKANVGFNVGEFVKITAGPNQGQSGYIQIKIEGLEKNVFPVRIGYRTINVNGKDLVRAKQPSAGEKRRIDYAGRLPHDFDPDPNPKIKQLREYVTSFRNGEREINSFDTRPLFEEYASMPSPPSYVSDGPDSSDEKFPAAFTAKAPFSDLSLHRHQ